MTDLLAVVTLHVQVVGWVDASVNALLVTCDAALDGLSLWRRVKNKLLEVEGGVRAPPCGTTALALVKVLEEVVCD